MTDSTLCAVFLGVWQFSNQKAAQIGEKNFVVKLVTAAPCDSERRRLALDMAYLAAFLVASGDPDLFLVR